MRYFEDFHEGETIELGSFTVSREEIIEFARQFDPQPFHLDEEQAKKSLYGGLIASGWHTGSLFMRLLVTQILNQSSSQGSPGLDELRWLKPVRPGDVLQAQFVVLETRTSKSRPSVGIVRSRSQVINQHGETVMTMLGTNMFSRRPEQG